MASSDTKMTLTIQSSKTNSSLLVSRFREYRVDIDLETDSNGVDFVVKNPNGIYSGLFGKFDKYNVAINGTGIMAGRLDVVETIWGNDDSYLHLSGRDLAAPLVDNDALPITLNNLDPAKYFNEKCSEYGIPKVSIAGSIPVISTQVIGINESEMSVLNSVLVDSRKRKWLIYDTMYVGEWTTTGTISYIFSRAGEGGGIPIKSLNYTEDGTSMISEMIVYGSMTTGENKVVGKAVDSNLQKLGVKKRKTGRANNNDSSSKYQANAQRDVSDGALDSVKLNIKTKTGSQIILPGKIAKVSDKLSKVNGNFFIKSVSYSKNLMEGSNVDIVMVLGG